MNRNEFLEFCKNRVVFLDGATGSNLMKAGMPAGVCPEKWILEHREVMQKLSKAYADAGSDIVYAPTFTSNRIKLEEYGLADKIVQINTDLVGITREAVGDKTLIAGDLTMTGRQLKPVGDLDFELNAFLVTRKGGDQSILYFPDQVAQALQAYLAERANIQPLEGHEDALFLSMQKRRMTQRSVENMVKKYALIAAPLKKRISPHKLRSTFGTNLYQETGDIYLVADVLGHSDVNTTRRHYAAMSDQNKRKASRMVPLPVTEKQEKE